MMRDSKPSARGRALAALLLVACSGEAPSARDSDGGRRDDGRRDDAQAAPADSAAPGDSADAATVARDAGAEAAPADAGNADRQGPADAARTDAALPPCPTFGTATKGAVVAAAAIKEASGLVASHKNAGVLWTHNDSGDSARIFALDEQGQLLGTYALSGAQAHDWEDMASGPGPVAGAQYLYVGDVGDNGQSRLSVQVYRVREPDVSASQAAVSASLAGVEKLTFVYPDGAKNCETLLVDPQSGDIYLVTKAQSGTSPVYRSPAPQSATGTRTLTKVHTLQFGSGALAVAGAVTTAGDVSGDGREVLVRTYTGAALWRRRPGEPLHAAFASAPCTIPDPSVGPGEAIAFAAQGNGFFTLAEGVSQPLFFSARR